MKSFDSIAVALAFLASGGLAGAQTITSHTVTTPYAGVQLTVGATTGPTTHFYAARIDLCTDYVHVEATRAPRALQSPGAWGTATHVQLATNGDFFTGSPPRVYGTAVGGGVQWPLSQTGDDPAVASGWYHEHRGWIAFGPGWVQFDHTGWVKSHASSYPDLGGFHPDAFTTAIPSGTHALVSGFPELITEGRLYHCSSPTAASCFPDREDMRARNPRTAMGLTRDLRTFILLVVDGREGASIGMYGTELANLMMQLGAWQAYNIDGGGSSQMWLASRGYLNDPSDGAPRSVANHWGIFAGSSDGQPRAPGSCMPLAMTDAGMDARDADAANTDASREASTALDGGTSEDAREVDGGDSRVDANEDTGLDGAVGDADAGCGCRANDCTAAGAHPWRAALAMVAAVFVARRRRARRR